MISIKSASSICLLAVFSASSLAASYIDSAATVVKVRASCTQETASGPVELDNCFQGTASRPGKPGVVPWIENTRKPNAASPLRVDIGPGNFYDITLNCDSESGYTGYIAFVGSGAKQTIITAGSSPVSSSNCTHLSFSNFKIITSYHWPQWIGGGESRWDNMELQMGGGGWDEPECGAERGKHYWYSSKLVFGTSQDDRGYVASCDESWFFGSEIKMGSLNNSTGTTRGHALLAEGAGEIHVYGGNIGALYGPNPAVVSPMIEAKDGGIIHIHGTGIDMEPYGDWDTTVFKASNGGSIHANSSAYAIDFSSGASITRIALDGGTVMAPYSWGPMTNPVDIISTTGSDTLIETDCSFTTCDDLGSIPHTLIYDTVCGVNPGGEWRDTQTGKCRGL